MNVTTPPLAVPLAQTRDRQRTLHHYLVWAASLTIVLLTALIYGDVLSGPLVFDDVVYLQENPLFGKSDSFTFPFRFSEFVTWPQRNDLDPDLAVNFVLRPVVYASFYLNFLADGFNPTYYHLVNVVIHAVNGLLILALLLHLLRRAGFAFGSMWFIAAGSAVLFTIHPMSTESVAYITQRFTSLGATFYLGALLLHFLALSAEPGAGRWALRIGSVGVLLLAMLSHEGGFTAPILAVVLDWGFLGTRIGPAIRRAIPLICCMPLIPVLIISVSFLQQGDAASYAQVLQITNSRDQPWPYGTYLLSQAVVVVRYMAMLILPLGQNIDPWVQPRHSALDPAVLLSLGVMLSLVVGLGWYAVRTGSRRRVVIAFCAVLWFFIGVGPSSSLVPLPDLMAEHRSYLGSIGVFILLFLILDGLAAKGRLQGRVVLAVAALMMAGMTYAAWERTQLWRDPLALWRDAANKNPQSFRALSNLGVYEAEAGNNPTARACFEKSVELNPGYPPAVLNLLAILLGQGQPLEVIRQVEALSRMKSPLMKNPEVLYRVALARIDAKHVRRARSTLEHTVNIAPRHVPSLILLGDLLWMNQQRHMALHYWTKAQDIQPLEATMKRIQTANNGLVATGEE